METGDFLVVISCVLIASLGALMYFKPSPYGNGAYGYRTPRAAKSAEAWFFAQKFSGRWLCVTMLILAFLRVYMVFYDFLYVVLDVSYLLLLCLAPIIIVVLTEKKLKTMQNYG